jgi:hypothetical protein
MQSHLWLIIHEQKKKNRNQWRTKDVHAKEARIGICYAVRDSYIQQYN